MKTRRIRSSWLCSSLVVLAACASPRPSSPPVTPQSTSPTTAVVPQDGDTSKGNRDAAAAAAAKTTGGASTPAFDALIAAAKDSRHGAEITQSLSDEVGPRLAGSAGDKAAVAWALARLKAEGLSNVHAEAVKAPHWDRGSESAEITLPYPHKLAVAALGGSIGTKGNGIDAEVVEIASLEALDAVDGATVKDKIVFIGTKMERAADGSGYGKAVGMRAVGAAKAATKGAAAFVIRSVGTDSDRLPHTGAMRRAEKGAREIPAAAISVPDAELLHRLIAAKKPVKMHLALGARWLPDADTANVVGEVPGEAANGEIVLLGAHLDSWDLGNGAIDDAAGVGIVVEAARLLVAAGTKAPRTLRVVLFANEENGLAGAKAYAAAHAAELDKHMVALESDFGGDKVVEARFDGGPDRREAFGALVAPLRALGIARSDGEGEGGADISPLRTAGVPTISLRQDGTRYFDIHHTANDTFDKIDPVALESVAAAYAIVARGALFMDGNLGRIPAGERGK